jgi:uroporphyrin-3 C-methyltransferase
MSDSQSPPNVLSPEPAERIPGTALPPAPSNSVSLSRGWIMAVLLLAGAALLVSSLLWQKLGNIQEELARRSQDAGAQSIEARTLAKAAMDSTRELTARLASQENRISEVTLQRAQLEELMQSLSRSRDENLVVDVDAALRLAQQQAQLAGTAGPLVAAITSASQRLQRAAQPRLNPLQRALTKDLDRIKAASLTDVPVLMGKIDQLTRLVDELPVANAMVATREPMQATENSADASANANSPMPASLIGWFDRQRLETIARRAWDGVRDEARKLLRVSRIEQPEAALMSPEQSFFLRENLKLRLLNARLDLLSRQTESARADLRTADAWLLKYFDQSSRKTQTANQLLQQIQIQLKTSELPRLDDTMAALATAAAGR